MNFKKCFSGLTLMLACTGGFVAQAQDTLTLNPNLHYRFAAKLSQGLFIKPGYGTGSGTMSFSFSPSFQWVTKRGNTKEVFLEGWQGAGSKEYFSIGGGVRAEHQFNLFGSKRKDWKLIPYLGAGVNPYFNYSKYTPDVTTTSFPSRYFSIGVRGYVAPGVSYHISNRVMASLSVPVNIFSVAVTGNNIQNPNLPAESQKYSVQEYELSGKGSGIRLGIGVKF